MGSVQSDTGWEGDPMVCWHLSIVPNVSSERLPRWSLSFFPSIVFFQRTHSIGNCKSVYLCLIPDFPTKLQATVEGLSISS